VDKLRVIAEHARPPLLTEAFRDSSADRPGTSAAQYSLAWSDCVPTMPLDAN
jgi:hypothetical protein